MSNPFRYFNSSPEVIRLVVMMYVRYPLSLRNVEDLLAERGIDISHETIRFWWNRFGPMFAAEIRKNRVAHMRYPQWRWHLDEVFVKVNGKLAEDRHRRALLLSRGDERHRRRRSPGSRSRAQQSRGEFASAVSTTRARHAALSKREDVTEIQLTFRSTTISIRSTISSPAKCTKKRRSAALAERRALAA